MISPTIAQSATLAGNPTDLKMHYATMFGALISLFLEWTEGNLGDDRAAFVDHVIAVLSASPLSDSPLSAPTVVHEPMSSQK